MVFLIPLVKSGQVGIVAVALTFGSVATGAVGLRLLAATVSRRRLDASDWCILVAWALTMGLTVACVLEPILGGFGWHYEDIVREFGTEPITQYHKIIIPIECLWNLSLAATKISVLLFYTKVFAVTSLTLPARLAMVLVALLGTSGFLCTMLICRPFAYNWDLAIVGGSCGSQSAVFAVFGIMNLVTDVIVLAMPVPSLLKLRMPIWKKASLLATFTVGFFTCIASIARLEYLSKVEYDDVTYTSVTAVTMTAVEPSLAVLLACIPLLRPLVGHRASRRLFGIGATRTSRPRTAEGKRFSKMWMSSLWTRQTMAFCASSRRRSQVELTTNTASGVVRLGSTEAELRPAVLSSRYDPDEAHVELRYVLSPAEGVSHHAHVEAIPRQKSISAQDKAIWKEIQDVEADNGGVGSSTSALAIVVKQEWNVASEPKIPP